MNHGTKTLPRALACEAINVVLNLAENRVRACEGPAAERALATLCGIHGSVGRFNDGCVDRKNLMVEVGSSMPAVDDIDGINSVVIDALVAAYALLEVSE